MNYAARYPGKFTLLLRETNIGVNKNAELTFKACIGKYIALCEGDDYWTDPSKLQKQVDFMEANPDYNFSMEGVDMLIEKTGKIQKRKEHVNPGNSEFFTLKDYLKGSFSQTSSFFVSK